MAPATETFLNQLFSGPRSMGDFPPLSASSMARLDSSHPECSLENSLSLTSISSAPHMDNLHSAINERST